MRKLASLAAVVVVGCASSSANLGPASPCASDLLQGGYVTDKRPSRAQSSAETYCTQYTAAQIAIAKDLHDKKYAPLADGLALAARYQPAEIACAKRSVTLRARKL